MAYLVLSNGMAFEGERIGAAGESIGELVFTTGVVGYLETLTDPAYAGQIVMQTFPLIGNYGVIEEDFESECTAKGYVVRELCDTPSNFRCQYTLGEYLEKKGVCGICGVDTRELTRILREEGAMNAIICDEIPGNLEAVKAYEIKGAVKSVSCSQKKVYPAEGEKKYAVTLMDFGVRKSLIRSLCARGCEVKVVPFDTAAEDVLADRPDGVVLSGGPGDPRDCMQSASQIAKLIGSLPVLGIGLGHQLAALGMGGRIEKLPCGHRGGNQPVKGRHTGRTHITSQNHSYVVVPESLTGIGRMIFQNANDGTCEGMEYFQKNCITVQFDPEDFVLDEFVKMMGGNMNA